MFVLLSESPKILLEKTISSFFSDIEKVTQL